MMNSRFDLNLLNTLVAVLEEKNVTKAAERLHLSQPAVSAQLNKLREHFNDPLIVPAHRGVTPTVKAEALLPELKQTLSQLQQTLDQHQVFDPTSAQLNVSLAATDYLQSAILTPLINALRDAAPSINVSMMSLDFNDLASQMYRQSLDLIFMCPTEAPADLKSRHLFEERYLLIARPNHPRIHDDLTVEEYAALDHLIVSLKGGHFHTPIDQRLLKMGLRRNVSMTVSSFLLMPDIVLTTDLVALVPSRMVQHRLNDFASVPCPVAHSEFQVGMLWHEKHQHSASHQWLREFIYQQVDR
ncbi:LysR family transcriptional regulator [Thaumasiovibrio subtropicus]|uniref:LysR family transcriptional regulator n=1 Tax=Thaumasiovibrio subtropicus TaxID=1891207 RepID=UPI00192CF446|nr:LysR family transcriptional regulator [Thaumasiovibrio subtropicus]